MVEKQAAPRTVSIALTGSGGAGVMTAGQTLLDAAARAGLFGLMTRSMGPQIRGGEAAAFVRLSKERIDCPGDGFDILIAFDWPSTERFAAEINMEQGSLLLSDPAAGEAPAQFTDTHATNGDLALKAISADIPGGRPNMVALGVIAALVGIPEGIIADIIQKALGKKGPDAVTASMAGVKAGFEAAKAYDGDYRLVGGDVPDDRWNISGNEAIGLGALRSGVRFVAAYPITPATEVLEWLAPNLEKVGGALVQAEDELASINMAIGGSFGGVPSLTATSGPGLSLMMEALGLAVASETPIVVVNVMRGGPSTGIPTKSEQSDLNIALYGFHGDAPHIVTSTCSVKDSIATMQWTVHLSEALQCPAIILTDQALGQTRTIIDHPGDSGFEAARLTAESCGKGYQRYAVTESGVSPMAIPGTPGGQYVADGLEHTERGIPSSQAEHHLEQLGKRERKLTDFDYGDFWADIEGEGDTAIITFGSATGPSREARARAAGEGRNVRLISVRLLAPAQPEKLHKALEGVSRVLVVEQNFSKQFFHYLRAYYDLPGDVKVFNQPGPLPIRPAQVYEQLANWR